MLYHVILKINIIFTCISSFYLVMEDKREKTCNRRHARAYKLCELLKTGDKNILCDLSKYICGTFMMRKSPL